MRDTGSQAIKALRESNVETILINPNVSDVNGEGDLVASWRSRQLGNVY